MSKATDGKKFGRVRREFTLEFKREAVRLMETHLEAGVPLAQVGRELGVRPEILRRWQRAVHAPSSGQEDPDTELRRLRRELEITRQERDFLKKAAAYFAKESP